MPAIVVVTHSRAQSLSRLLSSLKSSYINDDLTLYISIDRSNRFDEIHDLAKSFDWPFGEKIILTYSKNLGLKNHILRVGDLTSKHNFLIVLEDDLFVSPLFYIYAKSAFEFYKSSKSVFGIALYAPNFNETTLASFVPIKTHDAYFMQLPCSWGQIWYKESWTLFKKWLLECNIQNLEIPSNIKRWSDKSWKKLQLIYLMSSNLYYVYPCDSYTTNFGETGVHVNKSNIFQVPLMYSKREVFNFSTFEKSIAVYDSWYENERLKIEGFCFSFDVDLNCSKLFYDSDYVLTYKKTMNPILSFDDGLFPLDSNIIQCCYNPEGKISLTHKNDIVNSFVRRFKYYLRMLNIKPSLSFIGRLLGRY